MRNSEVNQNCIAFSYVIENQQPWFMSKTPLQPILLATTVHGRSFSQPRINRATAGILDGVK